MGRGGRLHTLTTAPETGPAVQALSYVYDKAGNITQLVDSHASETNTYAYDGLGRLSDWTLTGGTAESYLYDATSGNLASKAGVTYTYDTLNSVDTHAVVERSNGDTYAYDANGNMTQRHVGTQTFNLAYDAENRLVAVTGALEAHFYYDGDGRRVKSIMGPVATGVATYFVGNIYESTNGAVTKYYYAGGSRVAMSVDGTVKYVLSDHLGSTGVVTDASGAIVSELRYTPWGEVRYSSGSTPTDYTFTGQYSNTSDFGLMFYNARWYDVDLGRFAQADIVVPAGVQGLDRYAYANNSPVKYTDPTGRSVDCGGGSFGCAVESYSHTIVILVGGGRQPSHCRWARHSA